MRNIKHHSLDLIPIPTAHDLPSLKEAILRLDYNDTSTNLDVLSQQISELRALRKKFIELCRQRETRHAHTFLSMFVTPKLPANEWYWEILLLLFQPKDLRTILAILVPQVKTYLVVEPKLKPIALAHYGKQANSLAARFDGLTIVEKPIADLFHEPPELERLATLIIHGHYLFDLNDYKEWPLYMHESLHASLNRYYPDLAKKVYSHNRAMKNLEQSIELTTHQGQTFKTALNNLRTQLYLGSENMTGLLQATISAQAAFTDFKSYLYSLPEVLQIQLLNLAGNGRKVSDVITHLKRGDCVFAAANYLQSIIDNPFNAAFLEHGSILTTQDQQQIQRQYGKGRPIATLADDSITALPAYWLKQSLSHLKAKNAYELIGLLLTFPESLYQALFQSIELSNPIVSLRNLVKAIKNSIFNDSQREALVKVLIIDEWFKLLIDVSALLDAVLSSPACVNIILRQLSESECLSILQKMDASCDTLLHHAVTYPESLRVMLMKLSDQQRSAALLTRARYSTVVLKAALDNKAALQVIFTDMTFAEKLTLAYYHAMTVRFIFCPEESNPVPILFQEVIATSYLDANPTQVLIDMLTTYCQIRHEDKRQTFLPKALTFIGRGYTKAKEIIAISRVIELLNQGKQCEINSDDMKVFKQGMPKKLISAWEQYYQQTLQSYLAAYQPPTKLTISDNVLR